MYEGEFGEVPGKMGSG